MDDNRTFVAPHPPDSGGHLATYLQQHSRHEPQTLSGYARLVRLHITPHLSQLLLTDITPAQLNRLDRVVRSAAELAHFLHVVRDDHYSPAVAGPSVHLNPPR
ncbi:hypothetical protein [Kineococcus aurantiacus]|uniref:DNA-binding FadR family transcriptional regulator n=1 Tax=Kineococcus aurantiacus TaxID=37633 RepID=A0A7Y9J348_9ACTN|nr:hypothetical protein [Kineococcus aurantiacus]NYD24653.1 DNA-binding FadR family transcriptional regulator [Kineococcus aurantiacus]